LDSCFDAFSLREPVSTSLKNAGDREEAPLEKKNKAAGGV
jgi:hypothetical protein